MKISLVGGGGYAWTPMLMTNFITNPFFNGSHICLMDINEEALAQTSSACRKTLVAAAASRLTIETTTDLDDALKGADYVIVAIAHGGIRAEVEDLRIGRKYGYFNMGGEEVGVSGCSRTLRHVPEIVRIARRMEDLCPDAEFLNVSNPLTALTRSINKYTGVKGYGFCHGVVNHLSPMFPLFGADSWDGVDFNVAGVDHCSWLLDIRYKGQDALAIMREKGLIDMANQGRLNVMADDPFANREQLRLRFMLWGILGYMPAISDRHIIEFFAQIIGRKEYRDFFNVDSNFDRPTEKLEWAERYKDDVLNVVAGKKKPSLNRSAEIVDRFICARAGGGALLDVMNVPNVGQVPNLPRDSVVETKCLVDATGVHPVIAGPLPPVIESIVRPIIIRQELYMEAAMENSFEKLRAALSTDPLVCDFRYLDEMCRELLDYNSQFKNKD
jgi:alpha-galactosidase